MFKTTCWVHSLREKLTNSERTGIFIVNTLQSLWNEYQESVVYFTCNHKFAFLQPVYTHLSMCPTPLVIPRYASRPRSSARRRALCRVSDCFVSFTLNFHVSFTLNLHVVRCVIRTSKNRILKIEDRLCENIQRRLSQFWFECSFTGTVFCRRYYRHFSPFHFLLHFCRFVCFPYRHHDVVWFQICLLLFVCHGWLLQVLLKCNWISILQYMSKF